MRVIIFFFFILLGLILVAPYLGIDPLGKLFFSDHQFQSNDSKLSRDKLPTVQRRVIIEEPVEDNHDTESSVIDNTEKTPTNSSLADIEELLQDR